MFDFFLSHSKRDLHVVDPLRAQVEMLGYAAWYDEEQIFPGDDWEAKIASGIRACGSVLFAASVNSFLSENCRTELLMARRYNKRIIPLILDDSPTPAHLAWLDRFDQIRYAANGDHMIELKRVFPPRGAENPQPPPLPMSQSYPDVVAPHIWDHFAENLPWLVNRSVQKEAVENLIAAQLKPVPAIAESPQPGGPIVVILHGAQQEEPREFQQLLAETHLPEISTRERLLGFSAGTRYAKLENHRVTPCSDDDLKRPREFAAALPKRLARQLPGRVEPNLKSVTRRLESSPACHIFSFRYLSSGSQRQMRKFLTGFLDFWASSDWRLAPESRCLVTLSITHLPRKNRARAVERLKSYGQKKMPEGRFLVLEALESVSLGDALDWLALPAVEDALKLLKLDTQRLESAIIAAFGPRERLPMQDLVPLLRKILATSDPVSVNG